jgi:hypothetical protein
MGRRPKVKRGLHHAKAIMHPGQYQAPASSSFRHIHALSRKHTALTRNLLGQPVEMKSGPMTPVERHTKRAILVVTHQPAPTTSRWPSPPVDAIRGGSIK